MALLDPFNPRSVAFQVKRHRRAYRRACRCCGRTACPRSRAGSPRCCAPNSPPNTPTSIDDPRILGDRAAADDSRRRDRGALFPAGRVASRAPKSSRASRDLRRPPSDPLSLRRARRRQRLRRCGCCRARTAARRCSTARIDVTPTPAALVERADFFGNRVAAHAHRDAASRTAIVTARRASSSSAPAPPLAALTPAWESVAAAAAATASLDADFAGAWRSIRAASSPLVRAGDRLTRGELPAGPADLRSGARARRAHQGGFRL